METKKKKQDSNEKKSGPKTIKELKKNALSSKPQPLHKPSLSNRMYARLNDADMKKLPVMVRTLGSQTKVENGKTFVSVIEKKVRYSKREQAKMNKVHTHKRGMNLNGTTKLTRYIHESERKRYKEIIDQQADQTAAIPRRRFDRIVREIMAGVMGLGTEYNQTTIFTSEKPFRITKKALELLREASEKTISNLLGQTAKCTLHRSRLTTTPEDMRLAMSMNPSWDSVRYSLMRKCDKGINEDPEIAKKFMDLV